MAAWQLDTERRLVLRSGADIPLAHREFQILEFLMAHPREMFTTEEVFRAVWGNDASGVQTTVNVHLRWLREKLELSADQPEHLVTKRVLLYVP